MLSKTADADGQRLRILTWHVHGNYLYALTQVPHEFFIPVGRENQPGYAPLGSRMPWGANVHQVAADRLGHMPFDCVLYQSRQNLEDARELLTPAQWVLPCAYIEHDPPQPHPTNTKHWFRHDKGVLVHVTHYNAMMWDADTMPVRVIEHAVVPVPGASYTGELSRGITVINHLKHRGRRMGADLYEWACKQVPLDLIGMGSLEMGGLGEVPNLEVASFMAGYRFFFTPIRYTSLGLSLVEAMSIGMPVVGVAATELPTVISNGVNGYVDTRIERIAQVMRQLIAEPELAHAWGAAARRTAAQRFSLQRYVRDWLEVLATLTEDV
jgi:hypothetical protein